MNRRPSRMEWSVLSYLKSVATWAWGALVGLLGIISVALGHMGTTMDSKVFASEERIMGYLKGRREARDAERAGDRMLLLETREDVRFIKEMLMRRK